MQCVILAAGRGVRMRPLTDTTPKPLLFVAGTPILAHITAALPEAIDELVLVVNYLEEQIRDYCGSEYAGRRVRYVHQESVVGGTGDALWTAQSVLHGRFLVVLGDDLHGASALEEAVKRELCILAAPSDTPEKFGVIVRHTDGTLKNIIEKPTKPPTNLVSTGGMVLDERIFAYPARPHEESGEIHLPASLTELAGVAPVDVIEQPHWLPLGDPDALARANAAPPAWLPATPA